MGFSIFSNNDKIGYNIKNYVADTIDDLKLIPSSTPGSMVFVIDESKYYILNNNNTWVEKISGVSEPEGTISITANGTTNIAGYAEANVNVQPRLQNKIVTPAETSQTVTADNNYNGLGEVTVNAIPQEYIVPEGSLSIAENGNYNVTTYNTINVNIPIDIFETEYNDTTTRFFINLLDSDYLYINFYQYLDGTIQINWGDNSPIEFYTRHDKTTENNYIAHQYSNIGKYIISFAKENDNTQCHICYKTGLILTDHNTIDANVDDRIINFSVERIYEGWAFSVGFFDSQSSQAYSKFANLKKIEFADRNSAVLGVSGKDYGTNTSNLKQLDHSLILVKLPNNLSRFSDSAFYHCSHLKTIIIPENITEIPKNCFFACCSLVLNSLHNKITKIGSGAFASCYSLGDIFIFYGDITSIGAGAFYSYNQPNRIKTKKYKFPNNTIVPVIEKDTFLNLDPSAKIVVPDNLYEEWIIATNWVTYSSQIIKESDDQ